MDLNMKRVLERREITRMLKTLAAAADSRDIQVLDRQDLGVKDCARDGDPVIIDYGTCRRARLMLQRGLRV